MKRIYASMPLSGPAAPLAHDVLRGAELALERFGDPQVELVALDSFSADRERSAVANAQRAAEDPEALAYLGDFHSTQVMATAPLLEAAGLLAVAPVATFIGLRGDTLIRISPHDGVGARAIAAWLTGAEIERLLLVHDHDDGYGIPVGRMCAEAAGERGVDVRSRPVWDHDEDPAADLRGAQAVLYVGVAGSGAAGLWHGLHALDPGLWLLGSEGLADDRLAAALGSAEAGWTRFFVAQRAPMGFYGFEAMALALDAVGRAGPDRAGVVGVARSTRDRDSVIGRYSIDPEGHTTSTAYGCLQVVDGRLAWAEAIAG